MNQVEAGAEPMSHGEGDVGVLVLHGFTGNPSSLRPLAEPLAEAGHAIEMPLLPGHGTTWQHMQRTTWRQWAAESLDAFELLRGRTRQQIVIGLSMGGTLALHLAQTRGEDLAGMVLINPAVLTKDPRLKVLWLLKWVVPTLPGVGNDIAKPDEQEMAYDRVPLKALASMLALQAVARNNLSAVRIPTLIFTSRQDHVVDPANSALILDGVSSDDIEQVWLERSYHVATQDYDAQTIIDGTSAFIARVTGHDSAHA